MPVNTPSLLHTEQNKHWKPISVLLDGTERIRAAGRTYLPQQNFERDDDYDTRLKVATLYPAYEETLGSMAGRIFASQPVRKNVPDWIENEVLVDTDRRRLPFNMFAPLWFKAGLAYGHCCVLVDSPQFDGTPSVSDQLDQRLHPYYVLIKPTRILGVKIDDAGLAQIRITFEENVQDPNDPWSTVTVNTVRVYERSASGVTVTIHTENEKGEFVAGITRKMGQLKEIPIVTFYTGFVDSFKSSPPLRELAYLNIKHYVQQSAYDSIVLVAMIPILTLIGADSNDELKVGSRAAVKITNPDGNLKYTEHTGAAMRTGRESLDKIKEEMRESGAKLLLPATSNANKTATQASEEAQRENSPAQVMVSDFQSAVEELFRVTGLWRTGGAEVKASYTLRPNLKPDFTPADTAKVLIELADRSLLSRETLHTELQRRDIISDTLTWEDEKERIAVDPKGYLIQAAESKGQLAVDQNPAQ